jgi:hypothetical protein
MKEMVGSVGNKLILGIRTDFLKPITYSSIQCHCKPFAMMFCHQKPSEPNVFHVLSLASGGRNTAILNATFSEKKLFQKKLIKTMEMTINPNHTPKRPKISCWKDPFGSSVDQNFANRR